MPNLLMKPKTLNAGKIGPKGLRLDKVTPFYPKIKTFSDLDEAIPDEHFDQLKKTD